MKAILPGRPVRGRQALCTAQWDGLRLVAYISGNTAVILRAPQDIIQTISIDHVESLSAIVIDESAGKIAVCNDKRILIFNPIGRDQGDLRWTQAHDITVPDDNTIHSLSWGTSEEILVGGTKLWLYHVQYSEHPRLIWESAVANEVTMAYFSNDAELIASCGKHDRLVKIWRRLSFELDTTRFDVSYLPHPAAVIDLHWRKPWHKEQNLDTLLYTFCSDNEVRVWSYSDPHSLSVMQLIASIDTNTSIEPRRRSIGSISRKRYVFVFDSRDFSHATERAIQKSHNQAVDHALEHLIEIANRSPELCVVFDGLGHMSVWGLENAGCKSKKPAAVFNISLVDQVDIDLGFQHDHDEDYIQFCAFEGGFDEASLSLLVHSYSGQIDWYESPVAHFFDTTSRKDRVKLLSSWSGHDRTVDHIARGTTGNQILSWTDEGQAILWSQSRSGALRRRCEIDIKHEILSVLLFDTAGHALVLHPDAVSLWDIRYAHGSRIAGVSLDDGRGPTSLQIGGSSAGDSGIFHFILSYKSGNQEVWQACPQVAEKETTGVNGTHSVLNRVAELEVQGYDVRIISCDFTSTNQHSHDRTGSFPITELDRSGRITSSHLDYDVLGPGSQLQRFRTAQTNVKSAAFARACLSGKCALVAQDRKCLTIWDLEEEVCEWHYEHKGTDEIQKLVWTATTHGNLCLFVGFSYSALFIGQFRYPAVSARQSAWYITQHLSLRDFTTNHVGDVCWLSNGDLAIATGSQIFVHENIVTEQDSPIIKKSQELVKTKSAAAIIDMANASLPIFRSEVLEALVIEDGLEFAETVLRTMYEKLKYFSEGDDLASDLGLSVMELLFHNSKQSANSTSQVNGNVNGHSVELEEVEKSFKGYLDNAQIWQLGPKRRGDISKTFTNIVKIGRLRKSLDQNALRYLYAYYSTPSSQDLSWSAFVFASRSTSHEALVDIIMTDNDGKLTWAVARRTGLFVWLTDRAALQNYFENVARAEYNKQEERNPIDCSLHYLALNKKPVLQGLWRMTYGNREKENTMKLLANNFDEPRWKSTALKNAYALLSKRRFEYAAAFFLLGGGLKDAVNVCVNQLKDIQLAIAVARVWDKDPEQSEKVLQELLEGHVLEMAIDDEQGRWMAAWAYTILDEPVNAIRSVVRPLHLVHDTDLGDFDGPVKSLSFRANDPHLNILYVQLRQEYVKKNQWTTDVLRQREEWQFILRCAKWWIRAGMDYLALKLLREWKFVPHQQPRQLDAPTTLVVPVDDPMKGESGNSEQNAEDSMFPKKKKQPPPTQFFEPSADSLLDSFGF